MKFLKICALSKNLKFSRIKSIFSYVYLHNMFHLWLDLRPFCTNFSKMGKKLGAYRYVKTFVGLGGVGQGASGGRSSCGIRKEEANGGSGQLWRTRVKFSRSNNISLWIFLIWHDFFPLSQFQSWNNVSSSCGY